MKKKKKHGKGLVTLDEVIEIPDYDPRTLDPKELRKYGEFCTRKAAQEKMRKERKSKQILEDVRDILQQVFPDVQINEDTPILDQLATLANEINAPDIDAKKKIEEREEAKIKNKLPEKISQEVEINKVKLSKVITNLQTITLKIIQILFHLCTVEIFTIEVSEKIKKLDVEILASENLSLTEPDAFHKNILKVQELRWLRVDMRKQEDKISDQVTELLPHLKIIER